MKKFSIPMAALIIAFFIVVSPLWARAEEDAAAIDPSGKFLDKVATDYALPTYYGEMLDYLTKKSGGQFETAARFYVRGKTGEAGQNLAKLAATKATRDTISFWAKQCGRAVAALDIGKKLSEGDKTGALESGIILLITEAAATKGGEAFLTGLRITPPILSAVILSYQVYRESSKMAASEEAGRLLQSLYGGVENMTRVRGRHIGEGDPFPPTGENIEKIWKRLKADPGFRANFKIYVNQELKQTFPEPGWFDSFDVFANAPAADDSATRTRAATTEAEVKGWIAKLVDSLNKVAKSEEQQTLLRQKVAELNQKLQANGGTMEAAMAKFDYAIANLGVVDVYLNNSADEIKKAIAKDDYETLIAHLRLVPTT